MIYLTQQLRAFHIFPEKNLNTSAYLGSSRRSIFKLHLMLKSLDTKPKYDNLHRVCIMLLEFIQCEMWEHFVEKLFPIIYLDTSQFIVFLYKHL